MDQLVVATGDLLSQALLDNRTASSIDAMTISASDYDNANNVSVSSSSFNYANVNLSTPALAPFNAQNYSNAEIEEVFTSLSFEEELFWIFIYLPMIAVAAGGNTIVIYTVIANREMKSVTNYFLVNLSFADTMVSTLNVIFNFISMLNSHWPFGPFYCRISNFIAILSISASVFTLTAISCDRYNAIIHPLKPRMSHRAALGWIIAIWSLSVLLAAPNQIYSDTIEEKLANGEQSRIMCANVWPDGISPNSSMDHIYNVVILIVTYIVPIVTMALLYYKVGSELWGSQAIGENTDKQLKGILAKKKIVKMMIVVVTIFALCWFPYHAVFVANFYGHRTDQRTYLFLYWLAMSNSMYNPIIIYFMNSKFRRGFKHVFCCRCFKSSFNEHHHQPINHRNQCSVGAYSNYRTATSRTVFAPKNTFDHHHTTTTNNNNNNNNNNHQQRAKSFAVNSKNLSLEQQPPPPPRNNHSGQQATPLLLSAARGKPTSRHLSDLVPGDDGEEEAEQANDYNNSHGDIDENRRTAQAMAKHDATVINERSRDNQTTTDNCTLPQVQGAATGARESQFLVSTSEPTSTHSNVTNTTTYSHLSASSSMPLRGASCLIEHQQHQIKQLVPLSESNAGGKFNRNDNGSSVGERHNRAASQSSSSSSSPSSPSSSAAIGAAATATTLMLERHDAEAPINYANRSNDSIAEAGLVDLQMDVTHKMHDDDNHNSVWI